MYLKKKYVYKILSQSENKMNVVERILLKSDIFVIYGRTYKF